ncbi:MAG: GGDEF domain-containing protein [Desulfobulbaceae bacterium]|nr:GGDEF domain-containing protein [Desulfobulbaceae bacterium]
MNAKSFSHITKGNKKARLKKFLEGRIICRTISLGVSSLDFAKEITREQLLKMADDALSRAKEAGAATGRFFC